MIQALTTGNAQFKLPHASYAAKKQVSFAANEQIKTQNSNFISTNAYLAQLPNVSFASS